MFQLEHNGYYPLTEESLDRFVPARPGIYMLAVHLPNGVHQNFFTSQSDNLYRSLRTLASRDPRHVPEIVLEHLERYQCYFTYFVILKADYRNEVEKMLTQTTDPVVKLRVVNCN
jgi:hypothetical protein